MAHRIVVFPITTDARAEVKKKQLHSLGFSKIENVQVADAYTIDVSLSEQELLRVGEILSNPITQKAVINSHYPVNEFSHVIEIGFLPGVTDNVGSTARQSIQDLLKRKLSEEENIYTSQMLFLSGSLETSYVKKIAEHLANPLIQRIHIKNKKQFLAENGSETIVPKVKLDASPEADIVNILNASDEELSIIGKQGIANQDGSRRGPLALDIIYMKTIQEYFQKKGRNPTDVELESIAQTWSEHCKHTIFADPMDEIQQGLFKTYIKGATDKIREQKADKDFCVSVFKDNSGGIIFDENYLVTDKVETHNSPSALDPFGGAITGIVGVNRDTIGFGLGAKPVINRYGYCFADPRDKSPLYKGPNFTQKMLSSKMIMDGIIEGVNVGGNCSGIPTPQGFIVFDENYKGKPLVFVGTIGLIPRESAGRASHEKTAKSGDYVVMVGGRVGQDGIHGATFSSEALDSGSPATAVQIGDPITQKKLSDAIVKEARDMNLYNSITDNGAGGLSCSVAEMARECGGCLVQLEKVPLKYPGLEPWKIWISESQERMTLSIPKESWPAFKELMDSRGVEATIIGEFTNSRKCVVTYMNKIIMDLDMNFLHDGLPERPMQTSYLHKQYEEPDFPSPQDLTPTVLEMLARPNITSFEFISKQYDHEVQGGSVLKPLQGRGRVNADATLTKPLLDSEKGILISQGINPSYSPIDTYHMAACAIDTAIRNIIAVGADPEKIALLDNFCWCSSNEPERLGQLKQAVKACYDHAVFYGTPFISGKDSMFNDFKGYNQDGKPVKISVLPTLLISSISVMENVQKAVSLDAKFPGDLIYVLGDTHDELGGSEYFAFIGEQKRGKKYLGNNVPKVNPEKNKKLYQALAKSIEQELISSAQSIHKGGMLVALAKTALGGKLGIEVSLENLPGNSSRNDFMLFSESQGRLVVTIAPENKEKFEQTLQENSFAQIGTVTENQQFTIKGKSGEEIINTDIRTLYKSYKSTFSQNPSTNSNTQNNKPKALILTGYGINCDEETAHAFNKAGAEPEIVHLNDLIDKKKNLRDYQILAFPGGFSYGDDTGSGNALANRIKNHLWPELESFISEDKLVIGICNGFQVMVNLGLLPAIDGSYGKPQAALKHNDSAQYYDRWVDLKIESNSPWLKGISEMSMPIAHGEGKFYVSQTVLKKLNAKQLVAARYITGEMCEFMDYKANPNGSIDNIAAITDESGRLLGMMPHPERAISFTQFPNWTYLKEKSKRQNTPLESNGSGLQIFKNAVNYFKDK